MSWADPIDVEEYRTAVSPGTLEEDVQFLSSLVPKLVPPQVPVTTTGGAVPERIDVRITRRKLIDREGKLQRDEQGRPVFETQVVLDVKGQNFQRAAIEYLTWRREFESAWIRSASSKGVSPPPTPLQVIFNNTSLSKQDRLRLTAQFYRFQSIPKMPVPTPNPKYWPLSDVIRIPDTSLDVQFNLRAARVTVLDASTSKVWLLPFPPNLEPETWMIYFKGWVNEYGAEKAVEIARREALKH